MEDTFNLAIWLPLLVPLVLLQLGMLVAALIHIFSHDRYQRGNRLLWVLVAFINFFGPIAYYLWGREKPR
jgi:drug/metabolite transporter (DMT)-like permease